MSTTPLLRERHAAQADKASDKWSAYLDAYQEVFAAHQQRPVALLEIGVQNGGSLEVWARHFPNATRLVGCDIDPLCGALRFDDPRIAVVVGDAGAPATEAAIAALCPAYDIVIDDGSHRSGDIVRAFARYFPRLQAGGVYAVEDLHCSYWQQFEGGLFDPLSSLAFLKRLADLINHEHWGVPGARADLLRPFFERHGCRVDEQVLASIHSVTFFNSMCVVRREAPERNMLGRRLLVGSLAPVAAQALAVPSAASVAPSQTENRWSQLDELPEEWEQRAAAQRRAHEQTVAALRGELERVPQQIGEAVGAAVAPLEQGLREAAARQAALEASRSWRVTAPLRALGRWLRKR